MQFLVYAIIASTLSFEYLGDEGYAPSFLAYVQELLALAAAAVVVVAGVRQQFVNVLTAYWFIFTGLVVTLVCGILTSGVWETGLFGTTLVFTLLAMLFFDALHVSRGDGFMAALALGMMGVISALALSLFTTAAMDSNASSYLFWYTAGLVTAERGRALTRAAVEPHAVRALAA